MDGVLSPDVIDVLTGSADGRSWLVLIGAIMLAVVAVARYVTEDRLPQVAADWVSAVAGVVAAVAVAYMAGVESWWHGLLLGLLGSAASRGLWARVRELLPPRT